MIRRSFLAFAALLWIGATQAFAVPFASDRISVVTKGEGPDVVLVHGLGSSSEIWASTVQAVPGFRYHLVQINGFAGTDAGGNKEGAVIAGSAAEIGRYIAEADLDRPAIIGHSMGGTVALEVAARHATVSKLMVVDMLPWLGVLFAPPGAGPESVKTAADALLQQSLSASPEARARTIETNIASMVKNEMLRADPLRHALASDRDVTARAYHELIVTNLRSDLGRITAPALVLYTDSPTLPLTDAQLAALYQAAYAPLARTEIKQVPDSWHFVMLDQPEWFAAELRRFLAASWSPPTTP